MNNIEHHKSYLYSTIHSTKFYYSPLYFITLYYTLLFFTTLYYSTLLFSNIPFLLHSIIQYLIILQFTLLSFLTKQKIFTVIAQAYMQAEEIFE